MAVKTFRDYVNSKPGGLATIFGNPNVDELGVVAPTQEPDEFASRIIYMGAREPKFLCDCGRLVDFDVMVDFENDEVPVGQRIAANVRSEVASAHVPRVQPRRFACDGCWTYWIASKRVNVDKNDIRRAMGAAPLFPDSRKPW